MPLPDLVNGLFELLSSGAVWFNTTRLLRDREVKGYSVGATTFFTLWGIWNLYYYPHLGQLLSLAGGVSMVIANVVNVALTIHYIRKNRNVQITTT